MTMKRYLQRLRQNERVCGDSMLSKLLWVYKAAREQQERNKAEGRDAAVKETVRQAVNAVLWTLGKNAYD